MSPSGIDREDARMRSKRQTTMAKMQRERLVRERREKKEEKRRAAADERNSRGEQATGEDTPGPNVA